MWVIRSVQAPLGVPFHSYLRCPRQKSLFGTSEFWDEEHDALVFKSYWSALWQAFRHIGSSPKIIKIKDTKHMKSPVLFWGTT